MFQPGLVSITFRQLAPAEIIAWSVRAQLKGIEWGGDGHVPPGDICIARAVGRQTREAGLQVAAYGSYYTLAKQDQAPFGQVLDTAVALETSIIRIWPGQVASADADEADRERIYADGRRIAALAAAAGVRIACEWHGGNLTDTAASAAALFAAVDHPNFLTYWQPHRHMGFDACLADMNTALPRLCGVHVFQWQVETGAREPLANGEPVWPGYLEKAAPAGELYALLEFVLNDDPGQLLKDSKVLRDWLERV